MGNVKIKSFRNGIEVILDPSESFEAIRSSLAEKFSQSSKFFGDAKMAISFVGRTLSEEEEDMLISAIESNSQVEICCVLEKEDSEGNTIFLKAMNRFAKATKAAEGQVYKGSVRAGEVIETAYNAIILGDVNPGAKVIAGGNIIVLGTLYGMAHAGAFFDDDYDYEPGSCFICAMDIKQTTVEIGDIAGKVDDKTFKRGLLSRNGAKIIYELNGEIAADIVTKEFLNELPF